MMKNKINMREYEQLIPQLSELFGNNLVSIVLFGSFARGNFNENSDVDIIVVVNKYKKEDLSKLRRNFLISYEKRLDLHIFSKDDIISNFEHYSPLFVTLILGNKILLDKKGFFEENFRNFTEKMIKNEIKYCEGGKIWQMRKEAKNLMNLQ